MKPNELADETFDIVCAAYAYAEYLLCDTKIKQKILRVLQSHPNYWQAVAEDPKRHIAFAIRLQNHNIYYNALRHLVNYAYSSVRKEVNWSDVVQAMGSDAGLVQKFFEPQLQGLEEANILISAAIPAYSYKPKEIHPILGECFYGSSSFNEHRDGYFTNMNLPVDVPWDKRQAKKQRMMVEEVDEEVNETVVLGVDMQDASKEWLGAVAVALGTGADEALASVLRGVSLV